MAEVSPFGCGFDSNVPLKIKFVYFVTQLSRKAEEASNLGRWPSSTREEAGWFNLSGRALIRIPGRSLEANVVVLEVLVVKRVGVRIAIWR